MVDDEGAANPRAGRFNEVAAATPTPVRLINSRRESWPLVFGARFTCVDRPLWGRKNSSRRQPRFAPKAAHIRPLRVGALDGGGMVVGQLVAKRPAGKKGEVRLLHGKFTAHVRGRKGGEGPPHSKTLVSWPMCRSSQRALHCASPWHFHSTSDGWNRTRRNHVVNGECDSYCLRSGAGM